MGYFMFKFILICFSILLFSGCTQSSQTINKNYKMSPVSFFNDNYYTNLDSAIVEISNQLLLNINNKVIKRNKVVLTSFVNLHTLSQTSVFGRVIEESLINELHKRRFKIIDFRARDVIAVNKTGEFSLTRDINKLRDEMPAALVLVGTYSLLEADQIVINARIIDSFTGDVLSTARVMYKYYDCHQFDVCEKLPKHKKEIIKYSPIIKSE